MTPEPAAVRASEPPPDAARRRSAIAGAGASGYGPYFGSIPDFAEGSTGVQFADVREGSPAAKAGLQGRRHHGRVRRQADPEPLRFHLRARARRRPGDEVMVKVLRGTETDRGQGVAGSSESRPAGFIGAPQRCASVGPVSFHVRFPHRHRLKPSRARTIRISGLNDDQAQR